MSAFVAVTEGSWTQVTLAGKSQPVGTSKHIQTQQYFQVHQFLYDYLLVHFKYFSDPRFSSTPPYL
jgi:hypothetical protein